MPLGMGGDHREFRRLRHSYGLFTHIDWLDWHNFPEMTVCLVSFKGFSWMIDYEKMFSLCFPLIQ